ncbi:MAG: hypothetical protein JXR86_04760 [Spirochaetales bacterium]|nr:hypothetical protein [Spirochaetales bacterium]
MLLILSVSVVNGQVISDIQFSGLVRTKEKALLKQLPHGIGDPFSEKTIDETLVKLHRIGVFSEADVNPREDGDGNIILEITLEEQWTLIPLPVVSASNQTLAAGLFLLESNLFGNLGNMLLGFTYSEERQFATFSISNPRLGSSPLGIGFLSAFVEAPEDKSILNFSTNIMYLFNENLSIEPGLRYIYTREGSLFTQTNEHEQVHCVTAPVFLKYDGTKPSAFFPAGFSADLRLTLGTAGDEQPFIMGNENLLQYQFVPSPRHQFDLVLQTRYDYAPSLVVPGIGGNRGSKSLAKSTNPVDALFNVDLTYQWVFWSNRTFYSTLLLFGEAGAYHDYNGSIPIPGTDDGEYTVYSGIGAGVKLYLKRIAIPTVGLDVAYSIVTEDFLVSFNLGISK